jgi:cytochrome c oxidase assembly protein subunit 15
MDGPIQIHQEGYNRKLHRFAWFTAGFAIFLIVAGATVTSTGSGDTVPDWPLAYHSIVPPLIGGIVFEYSHRVIAGITSLLVTILAIWLWRSKPRQHFRWLGIVALLGVFLQASLGALRVLVVSNTAVRTAISNLTGMTDFQLDRIAFATAHGILAQTILCTLFAIILFTSRSWLQPEKNLSGISMGKNIRWFSLGLLVLVFAQLIMGTLIRYTGASLIIPDFPLSFGRLIPPFGNLPQYTSLGFPISRETYLLKVILQFTHRLNAFLIFGTIIYLFMSYRKSILLGQIVFVLLFLIVIQIIFGALNIWTARSVFSTVPHVAVGALILATSIIFLLWSWRLSRVNAVRSETVKSQLNETGTPKVAKDVLQ